MIQNLLWLAYIKTLILALGFGLSMWPVLPLLKFWSGFLCGVVLTLAAEGTFLYILLGMRGVQADPSSLALSPLKAHDILQTTQNGGFQEACVFPFETLADGLSLGPILRRSHGTDIASGSITTAYVIFIGWKCVYQGAGLNVIVAVFWPCIAKLCGARIKKILQEILDGHAVDAIKNICMSGMASLRFGQAIDQVLRTAKEKLEDKLESILLGLATNRVILKEVDFGTKPPEIIAFRCESGVDEIIFEIKFRWESEGARSRISIDIRGHRDIIQVENVRSQGTVKIALKSLREEFPGFGALVVSLKEAPLVNFNLKVLDGLIGDIPYVTKYIHECIESALAEFLIWPNRFVLPLIPVEDFSFLESRAVGKLRVRLIKAEDIVHTHHIGTVHHFVEIFVCQSVVKCSTLEKSSKPAVWDETMTIEVQDPQTQNLTLQLFRTSRVSRLRIHAKFIGSLKLAITQFQPVVTTEMSCDLKDPGSDVNEIYGKLYLAITYHPNVGAGEAAGIPEGVST